MWSHVILLIVTETQPLCIFSDLYFLFGGLYYSWSLSYFPQFHRALAGSESAPKAERPARHFRFLLQRPAVYAEAVEQPEGWRRLEKLSQGALEARENLLPNPEHKLTRSLLLANRGIIKFTNTLCTFPTVSCLVCVFRQQPAVEIYWQPCGNDWGFLANRAVLVRSEVSQTLFCKVYLGKLMLSIHSKASFVFGLFHLKNKTKQNTQSL